MPGSVLVADADPRARNWLDAELSKEGYSVTMAETGTAALSKAISTRPNLVILDPTFTDMPGPELCQRLRQDRRSEAVLIVVFALEAKPEDVVACLDAGADEYLGKRCGRAELVARLAALLRCSTRLRDAGRPRGKGNLVSFFSAKGGSGTTSICLNLAASVKEAVPQNSVLLVDMVLPVGSVAAMAGVQSSETVVGVTSQRDQPLDRFVVENFITETSFGFDILPGARDPGEAQLLQVDKVEPLFQTLRSMYDYVFVDFGRAISRVSLPVIERSDCLAVILSPDLTTVQLTKTCLKFIVEKHRTEKFFVVANLAVGRQGISREQIEEQLLIAVDGLIPHTEDAFTTSINRGVPFVYGFPDHFAAVALRELAGRLIHKLNEPIVGGAAGSHIVGDKQ
jgi:MinD-like ATPase involved in chromosome partitioning or flagellar assembly/CheY-like chemotaxis protein